MLLTDYIMYMCMYVSGDTLSELQSKLLQQTAELECFSKVIVCMAAMKFALPASERLLLQSVLCPILQEGSEQVCICMYVCVDEGMEVNLCYVCIGLGRDCRCFYRIRHLE